VTPRLVFRPQAEAELLEARGRYESQRAGLGQTFPQTVDQALASIVADPLAHPAFMERPAVRWHADFRMRSIFV
jgi:hypothetical protein